LISQDKNFADLHRCSKGTPFSSNAFQFSTEKRFVAVIKPVRNSCWK